MAINYPTTSGILRPCLCEGVITEIDYANNGCTIDLIGGGGRVFGTFHHGAQNIPWNWPGNEYPYSQFAYCVNDLVLVVSAQIDEDTTGYAVVAALEEDRSDLKRRWVWPAFNRETSFVCKFLYADIDGDGFGFPFISSDGLRTLVGAFTDSMGRQRAIGTQDGPNQYMVIEEKTVGEATYYIPHASHEFMTQADAFDFLPDVSGRVAPNYKGHVIGVASGGRLLFDNIHFATIGTKDYDGLSTSTRATSRFVVNVAEEAGVVVVSELIADFSVDYYDDPLDVRDFTPVYFFAIVTGSAGIDLCVHELMKPDFVPPTINLTLDRDNSYSYADLDDIITRGWYDNLASGEVLVGGHNAQFKCVFWGDDPDDPGELTPTSCIYSVEVNELGEVSTGLSYDVAPLHGSYVGPSYESFTRTSLEVGSFSCSVSGSIAPDSCKAVISESVGNTLYADIEFSISGSSTNVWEDINADNMADNCYASASQSMSSKVRYLWNDTEICSFVSSGSYSIAGSRTGGVTLNYLDHTTSYSCSATLSLIIFLHVDVKNGIFVYLKFNLYRNHNLLQSIFNDFYPSSTAVTYDLCINNRGAETLLHTFTYYLPSGDSSGFTTEQQDNVEAFGFFTRFGGTGGDPFMIGANMFYHPDLRINETSNYIEMGDIAEFWHTLQQTTFSLHPFVKSAYDNTANRMKWPQPFGIADPHNVFGGDPYYNPEDSEFYNYIMLAQSYVTREGASTANFYNFVYTFNIGGWTGTHTIQSANYDDILVCTGRDDAVLVLE